MELYVHIPFCVKKCGYCDFVSAPAGEPVQNAYMEAVRREIRAAGEALRREADEGRGGSKDLAVTSVFFGGGTPSIVAAEEIAETLACIRQEFALAEDAEITLEANPGTLAGKKLEIYRRAGVNRLSLGLQSADDRELRLLGRIHTFEEFREGYRLAREAGFSNINVDLMAALPGQTMESFEKSLLAAAGLSPSPEHISVYSLIIEEGTPFFERYHRQAEAREAGEGDCGPLPSEEEERAMYALTEQTLASFGYERYEISNYARPGFACRHNIGYWTGVPYLGFGISAASYINGKRFSNICDRDLYLRLFREAEEGRQKAEGQRKAGTGRWQGDGTEKEQGPGTVLGRLRRDEETVTTGRAMEEFMFLGLRMTEGVSAGEFERRFGKKMEAVYGTVLGAMEREGLMERAASEHASDLRWRLTGRGIDVSNYVLAEFLL